MKKHALYSAVMIFCFIYGGISFVFFLTQITLANSAPPITGRPPFLERFNETILPVGPDQELNITAFASERFMQFQTRNASYFQVLIFTSVFGSLISIIAGIAIYSLMRKKERKELTRSVIDVVTTPEEKLVLKELDESGGVLTQTELTKRTKLSKVKVHRVIKRLETIGIVAKYSYGMTNKIKLEKNVLED
jgi:uncharacterized membrane protein